MGLDIELVRSQPGEPMVRRLRCGCAHYGANRRKLELDGSQVCYHRSRWWPRPAAPGRTGITSASGTATPSLGPSVPTICVGPTVPWPSRVRWRRAR
jgi:hypothetical protein